MKSVRALRAKLSKEINKTFDEIIPEAEKEIAKAYHEASENYELPAYGPEPKIKDMSVDNFFQVNEKKLEIVITDVKRDMNKARYGAIERAGSQYKELIQKVDVMKQAGNVTLTQAIETASKDIAKQGLNCIEYKDGTRVNLTTYTELALRTSARRASLTAEGAKRDEWQEFLVVSPTLHSTCDSCQKWQGKILVDDVYANGKPDGKHPLLSEAIKPPSHFLGVNCRHPLVTYREGITQIPKASPYDQTKKNYEAEQEQRRIERYIRYYKRLENLGDANAKNSVKEWQKRMREHLKANPQLRRKPEREKLLGI